MDRREFCSKLGAAALLAAGFSRAFAKGGKAEPVDIVTGIRTEALVQAVAGLNEGDTVIVSGTQQLRTGMAVTIDNLH